MMNLNLIEMPLWSEITVVLTSYLQTFLQTYAFTNIFMHMAIYFKYVATVLLQHKNLLKIYFNAFTNIFTYSFMFVNALYMLLWS